jgi:glycosyltransferase involved in cell wall biosynthesis
MMGPSDPAPGIETPGDPNPAPELSVVIPAYNEEARIVPTLRSIAAYLSRTGARTEIVVVDDGSADGTRARVEELGRQVPGLRILSNQGNRGKGFSVRRGFLESRGELVLLTDADLSTPIEELERLAEPLRRGEAEIAVGSRALDPSRVEVPQGWLRQTMGKTFNRAVRLLTGLPIRDTQCGFKLLRRRAFLPIFEAARVDRFSYDVEILYLARRRGLRIAEIPVIWRNSPQSRVGILSAPLQMLTDVARIVLRERTGGYRRRE